MKYGKADNSGLIRFTAEPQSLNDVLRRSFSESIEKVPSESEIKNMTMFALTHRELNNYSRFIARIPVFVDLERNTVTA